MTTAADYRGFAIGCFRWADQTNHPSQRVTLTEIAHLWKNIATQMDQYVTPAGDEPARAKELRSKTQLGTPHPWFESPSIQGTPPARMVPDPPGPPVRAGAPRPSGSVETVGFSMDEFVHQMNLSLLRKQLAQTTDEALRKQLAALLAEEEAREPPSPKTM